MEKTTEKYLIYNVNEKHNFPNLDLSCRTELSDVHLTPRPPSYKLLRWKLTSVRSADNIFANMHTCLRVACLPLGDRNQNIQTRKTCANDVVPDQSALQSSIPSRLS